MLVWAPFVNNAAHWGAAAGFWLALVFLIVTNIAAAAFSWLAHAKALGPETH